MPEITDERINQLRLSIYNLRIFLNYSNAMKKKEIDNTTSTDQKNKEFNEDKIAKMQLIESRKLKVKSKTIGSDSNENKIIRETKKQLNKVNDKITVLPGECIVEQGEEGSSAFLIISGSFNVEINKKVVGSMSSGEIFGELSLILGEQRKATVRAITGSELVEINPSFLNDYLLSSKTSTETTSKSKLETQKIIKELSVELGKKSDHRPIINIEELSKIVEGESNIIKSLSIQLQKRLSKMISDNEKIKKIKSL